MHLPSTLALLQAPQDSQSAVFPGLLEFRADDTLRPVTRHSPSPHGLLRVRACSAARGEGFLAVDHPRDTEAVGAHAEAMCPEGLLERHGDRALLCQGIERTLRIRWFLDRHHHVEARRLVVLWRGVRTKDELASEVQARVNGYRPRLRMSCGPVDSRF
jgi:hypothetical protein